MEFNKEVKEALIEYDFEYFLKKNIQDNQYSEADTRAVYDAYKNTKENLNKQVSDNKKQFLLYVEGKVRKMFTGKLLPSHFELDDNRSFTIFEFKEYGINWAYFDVWKKYEARKLSKKKIWKAITDVGSILGYIATILGIIAMILTIKGTSQP
jgi:hypothetical protein